MPSRTTAPPTGEDREMMRLAAPVALWWVWLVFVAANVVDFAVQGVSSPRFGAVVSAILLFITGLVYTLALRPRLVADSTGITVLNPFRTHRVPWPLIHSVDTGEWVRVHYRPTAGPGEGDEEPGSHDTAILHCWALYVSAGARRKLARGAPRQRQRGVMRAGTFGRGAEKVESGFGSPASSRLPEEARHLASLPVASAMASRLDTRAARERQRARKAPPPQQAPAQQAPAQQAPAQEQATASWSLPALAAAVVPALILLIVALA